MDKLNTQIHPNILTQNGMLAGMFSNTETAKLSAALRDQEPGDEWRINFVLQDPLELFLLREANDPTPKKKEKKNG